MSAEQGPSLPGVVARTGFFETTGQKGEQSKWAETKGDGFLGKTHYIDPEPSGNGTRNGLGMRDRPRVTVSPLTPALSCQQQGTEK